MTRAIRWILIALAVLLAVLAAAAFGLRHWLGTDDFRNRMAQQASEQLGVPVQLGALSIDFWPLPAVTAEKVSVRSQPALETPCLPSSIPSRSAAGCFPIAS